MKMAIRTTVAEAVGRERSELRKDIEELEDSVNEMHGLNVSACASPESQARDRKVGLINDAITRLVNDLTLLREKQSAKRAFRAKAKWFEQGEKSNKYFMNLNKRYKKQKVIDSIVCDDVTFSGQDGVASGIVGFYKKLYSSSNSIEVGDEKDNGLGVFCLAI